ncbi:hypothetical protein [Wolbachia endosymbiont of Ctenocephalides felis wCfeT]|uniref:hypothetical protein n=1 Tax=Wolbachia endosymbiont of Ctenocephalides felis wCfeT TaxID=2732593 RepID=UPI001446B843|nr:hypothetical protein [Wolbachia endosymbiont of Ctenocephalides felis wCfeT]
MTVTQDAINALHKRIRTLAENSTPDQLAYLAKSLESIIDKKAISNVVQMTEVKEIIDVLQKKIKDLAANSTPDQVAYLAKALESIVDKSAVSDILQMSDEKLKELLSAARSHLNDIETNKTSSISSITAVKKESVNEINTLKTNTLDTLKASSDSYVSLLDTRKDTNIAAINSIGNDHKDALTDVVEGFRAVNDVPSGSSIMREVKNRNMVEPGSIPFIFGVLSRQNNYFGHGISTSEFGEWSRDVTKTDYILQLLAGTHTYDTSYVSFYRPRQLCFIEGSNGTFIYGELYTNSFSSNRDYIYYYPYAALGVIFVKNTTNQNIRRTINFLGSAGGDAKAELLVGTPDNTNDNKSRISRIAWKSAYKYTNYSSEFTASGYIEIPAGKTVVVLLHTSSCLDSQRKISEGMLSGDVYIYSQFIQWGIYNIRNNFLSTGLEVDVERTLRAWQCPGLQETYQIWQ